MYKLWFHNYLKTIGKWGGAGFLFGLFFTSFLFVPIASQWRILDFFRIGRGITVVHAYVSGTIIPVNSPPQIKLNFNSVDKLNDVTGPLTNFINNALKSFGLSPSINIGTSSPLSPANHSSQQGTDFSKFFSSSGVSSNDVVSFLKGAAVTGINLTILVITITAQVLKGLLSVIK